MEEVNKETQKVQVYFYGATKQQALANGSHFIHLIMLAYREIISFKRLMVLDFIDPNPTAKDYKYRYMTEFTLQGK